MRLLLLTLLLLPAVAAAAPSISGVSGTLTHGSSITISGSGFGTKSAAAPVSWGTHEGNSLNAVTGSWSQTGYPGGVLSISSANNRHGLSSYNATCNFNQTNQFCSYQVTPNSSSMFAQYWFRLDSAFDWGAANIKLFRLWATSGDVNLRVQSYNRGDVVVENADEGHGGYGTGWNPVTGSAVCADQVFGHSCNTSDWLPGSIEWRFLQTDLAKSTWHLMQFEFIEGTPNTANGTLRWWVDGKRVFDHSDITTRTSSSNKYVQVLGFYRDALNDGSGTIQLDDLYVDSTLQRVEIGNSATYDNCTLREIQPPTAWSDTGTTITLNQGSFADNSTGYIFVTDASGVRNTGYSITFGESGGGPIASCSDGIQNQDETGVDCGGVCSACGTPPANSGGYVKASGRFSFR